MRSGLWSKIKGQIMAARWSIKMQNYIAQKVHEANNGKDVSKETSKIYHEVMGKLNDGKEYTFDECMAMVNETLAQTAITK